MVSATSAASGHSRSGSSRSGLRARFRSWPCRRAPMGHSSGANDMVGKRRRAGCGQRRARPAEAQDAQHRPPARRPGSRRRRRGAGSRGCPARRGIRAVKRSQSPSCATPQASIAVQQRVGINRFGRVRLRAHLGPRIRRLPHFAARYPRSPRSAQPHHQAGGVVADDRAVAGAHESRHGLRFGVSGLASSVTCLSALCRTTLGLRMRRVTPPVMVRAGRIAGCRPPARSASSAKPRAASTGP